ncbi:MAG: DedA family protein [Gemmobacter sp.]
MFQDLPALIASADPVLILLLIAGLACVTGLGIPGPASLALIAAGAAVAAGVVDGVALLAAGTAGAVAGDLGGYAIGAKGAETLRRHAGRRPRLAALLGRAEVMLARHGLWAVFATRWAVPPLGPSVSLVSGAARVALGPFLALSVMGRLIWVALYAGLGLVFADAVEWAADRAATVTLWLMVLAVLGAGAMWWRARVPRL